MDILNMGTLTQTEVPLHCIIYGDAGCGKTYLVKDFPKPMLVFDFDQKFEPLIGVEGIDVVSYQMNKPEDARTIIPNFWRDLQAVKKEGKYKTVVLDSLTALDRVLERWAVIMCGKGKKADDRATIQEYGDMARWYKTLFPALHAYKGNMVVLAHMQHKEDEDGKLMLVRPFITGKIGDVLPSIFPHTFHLEYVTGVNERWKIFYRKHQKFLASSSSLSEGKGYVEYGRGENGYEVLSTLVSNTRKGK